MAGADGRPLARGFWDATRRSPSGSWAPRRARRRARARSADRGGAGAAARHHRSRRDRRLPLDPRRGRRAAGRARRRLRHRAQPSLRRRRRAGVLSRAAGAVARSGAEGRVDRRRHPRAAATRAQRRRRRRAHAAPLWHPARRRDRDPRERSAVRRRSAARAKRGAVSRPAREPRAGPHAGARSPGAEPVRLHRRVLDLRRGRWRARHHHRRRRRARDRSGAPNFERNRLPVADARFAAEDAFAFLNRAAAAGDASSWSSPIRRASPRASARSRRACAPTSGCIACAPRSPRPGGPSAPPPARATFERTPSSPPSATARARPAAASRSARSGAPRSTTRSSRNFRRATTSNLR